MTLFELGIAATMMLTLLILRFGIPILVMAFGRFVCCRMLHLRLS